LGRGRKQTARAEGAHGVPSARTDWLKVNSSARQGRQAVPARLISRSDVKPRSGGPAPKQTARAEGAHGVPSARTDWLKVNSSGPSGQAGGSGKAHIAQRCEAAKRRAGAWLKNWAPR